MAPEIREKVVHACEKVGRRAHANMDVRCTDARKVARKKTEKQVEKLMH